MPVRTPFVGREVERASLRRLVDDALAGRGGLALIAGEPGVGKSQLVAEIGDEAQARGMRMFTGHYVEMSGAPPYLPYVEMIEQAISNPRSPLALLEALGDVAAEIARIAPALRRAFPDIRPPVELPAELARRYVWNSLGEFIGRAAQGQQLLLVLEDLHWADESTVLFSRRRFTRSTRGRHSHKSQAVGRPCGQDAKHRRATGSPRRCLHGALRPDPPGGDTR
jgi:predicted ATPase